MIENLLNFIFPNHCGFCGRKINQRCTCEKCISILKYYRGVINIPVKKTIYYDKYIGLFQYKGVLKRKMSNLKFKNDRCVAKSFGEITAMKLLEHNIVADIIIPVPISKKRLFERGYNQTEYIARYTSKNTNIKMDARLLLKIKDNIRQSGLSRIERTKNVHGVYEVVETERILGKSIILMDDIYTTGATLNECARMLKRAGARSVIAVTILYGFSGKERSRNSCG